ncbi:MAG: Rpn family recombination-promoting nuclease/putative transposase [Lachnospiraceae bacterium]|nr:Rpn family recombination-promoting nuclease/putative transposase [Lachnospiraceae bacterium]
MGQLMKPKIDFAFKEIMGDSEVRKGFLSAVLKINPEDIKETKIIDTFLRKKHKKDKLGILDVRILMDDGTEIDVEIQLIKFTAWEDRTLFYVSKMITEQIKEGEDYSKIKKCIHIGVLDFVLFKDTGEFYSSFHLMEDNRHTVYSDKIEFHVIELPKLPEELKENSSDLLLWAKFLNAEKKEEFEMLAKKNMYIEKAYDRLQVISMDKKKQLEYTARQKAILDYNQLMKEYTEAGLKKGEEIGLKKGEEIGLKKGEEIGLKKGEEIGLRKGEEIGLKKGEKIGLNTGMVYAYYEMNMDTNEIAQRMQMTEEEVTDIIRKRNK